MKNRPQKSVPIFEVDFRSRLSTPISDHVSPALDDCEERGLAFATHVTDLTAGSGCIAVTLR